MTSVLVTIRPTLPCSGSPSQMADAANPNTGTSNDMGAIDDIGAAVIG